MIYISGRYPVYFMLIFARNGHFSSFIHGTNHTPSHLLSIWGHPALIICVLPTRTHKTKHCWSNYSLRSKIMKNDIRFLLSNMTFMFCSKYCLSLNKYFWHSFTAEETRCKKFSMMISSSAHKRAKHQKNKI